LIFHGFSTINISEDTAMAQTEFEQITIGVGLPPAEWVEYKLDQFVHLKPISYLGLTALNFTRSLLDAKQEIDALKPEIESFPELKSELEVAQNTERIASGSMSIFRLIYQNIEKGLQNPHIVRARDRTIKEVAFNTAVDFGRDEAKQTVSGWPIGAYTEEQKGFLLTGGVFERIESHYKSEHDKHFTNLRGRLDG
jgi:hypothetical protein